MRDTLKKQLGEYLKPLRLVVWILVMAWACGFWFTLGSQAAGGLLNINVTVAGQE